MIKAIIEDVEKEKYPCIKESSEGNIILFSGPKKGTILRAGSSIYSVGEYLEDWVENHFKPFLGSVKLFNE